jgi:hypothetical protein
MQRVERRELGGWRAIEMQNMSPHWTFLKDVPWSMMNHSMLHTGGGLSKKTSLRTFRGL